MSKVHIHIIAYNEHIILPFTIAHYRKMFDNPVFIIHDNNSTDNTADIAISEGCTVIPFTTDGMNDMIQSQIKSSAAMSESVMGNCDWVLCIDADEECLINTKDLEELEAQGVNAVEFQGWNIFDQVESPWDIKEPKGVLCSAYSKPVLLRTGVFQNVMFAAGAHSVSLTPKMEKETVWSKDTFKLLHYKHWSCDWNVQRSLELASRQSEENRRRNFSFHFAFPEQLHKDHFYSNFDQRVTIADSRI